MMLCSNVKDLILVTCCILILFYLTVIELRQIGESAGKIVVKNKTILQVISSTRREKIEVNNQTHSHIIGAYNYNEARHINNRDNSVNSDKNNKNKNTSSSRRSRSGHSTTSSPSFYNNIKNNNDDDNVYITIPKVDKNKNRPDDTHIESDIRFLINIFGVSEVYLLRLFLLRVHLVSPHLRSHHDLLFWRSSRLCLPSGQVAGVLALRVLRSLRLHLLRWESLSPPLFCVKRGYRIVQCCYNRNLKTRKLTKSCISHVIKPTRRQRITFFPKHNLQNARLHFFKKKLLRIKSCHHFICHPPQRHSKIRQFWIQNLRGNFIQKPFEFLYFWEFDFAERVRSICLFKFLILYAKPRQCFCLSGIWIQIIEGRFDFLRSGNLHTPCTNTIFIAGRKLTRHCFSLNLDFKSLQLCYIFVIQRGPRRSFIKSYLREVSLRLPQKISQHIPIIFFSYYDAVGQMVNSLRSALKVIHNCGNPRLHEKIQNVRAKRTTDRKGGLSEDTLLDDVERDIRIFEEEAKKQRDGEEEGRGERLENGSENQKFFGDFAKSGKGYSLWRDDTDAAKKYQINKITNSQTDEDISINEPKEVHLKLPKSHDISRTRNHGDKGRREKQQHGLYDTERQIIGDAEKQLDKDHERLFEEYLRAYQNLKSQGDKYSNDDYKTEEDGEGEAEEEGEDEEEKEGGFKKTNSQEEKALLRDRNKDKAKFKQIENKKIMKNRKHQTFSSKSHARKNTNKLTATMGDGRFGMVKNGDLKIDEQIKDGNRLQDKTPEHHKETDEVSDTPGQKNPNRKGFDLPHQTSQKTPFSQHQWQVMMDPLYDDTYDGDTLENNKVNRSTMNHDNNTTNNDTDTGVDGEGTGVVVDIVDVGHDKVILNVTKSPWKTILHGRRDVIITGCVIVSIAIIVLVIAIGSRLARWNTESNRISHLRRRQSSYRNLGSEEERWRLRKDENSNYSLFVRSSDEEEEEEYESGSDPP